jgi:hypothetical protein
MGISFFLSLTRRKKGKDAHFSSQSVTFATEIVSVLWLFKILCISELGSFPNRYLYNLHFIAEPCTLGT